MLVLLACAAPTGAPDTGPDSAGETGDAARSDLQVTPTWGVAEVTAVIEGDLAQAPPAPDPLIFDYARLLDNVEPGCPGFEDPTRGRFQPWATLMGSGCVTSAGWTWFGLAQAAGGCQLVPAGASFLSFGVVASLEVTSPEGAVYIGGGTFLNECDWTPDAGSCTGQVAGTFQFPGSDTDWIASGVEAAVYVDSVWDASGWSTTLSGGAGFGSGDIAFDELVLTATGAVGALAVRDPSGYWHEAVLGADGCGVLAFDGIQEGTICPDFSGWLIAPRAPEELCSER